AALPPLSVRFSRMALEAARVEALREQGLEASLPAPVVAAPSFKVDEQSAPPVPDWRAAMYSDEAIAYLGIGHLDRPDNALNRMMAQGVLPRRKLGGKLIFRREDLDRVLSEGSP